MMLYPTELPGQGLSSPPLAPSLNVIFSEKPDLFFYLKLVPHYHLSQNPVYFLQSVNILFVSG